MIGWWRFDHTGLLTKQQNVNTHVVMKCVAQTRQGVLTSHARVRKHFVCGHLSTAVNGVLWRPLVGSDTMLRARGKRKWFTGAMAQQQVEESGQTVGYSSSAGKHQTQISFRTISVVCLFCPLVF